MNDIKSKSSLDKIVRQAVNDKNIVQRGGILFNGFCESCRSDCRQCIGFDFASLLDGVISEFEKGNGDYEFDSKDYMQSLRAYKQHIKENGDSMIAPAEVTCAVHAETGIDEVQYSMIDFDSVMNLSNDITEYFLNSKNTGRVIVNKVKVPHGMVKYIKRNIKASDVGGYKLIGLVLTYCGLYAIITKDKYCHYDKINIIVKSVVSVNDCIMFNKVTDRNSDFQPVESGNTVIFYKDQVEDLQNLRFFRDLGKCPLVK